MYLPAQRPCSRCTSNGKEDTCVDVQHKKRGRPRLRDERESRYDNMGPGYPHPPEASMRRPVSFYGPIAGPSESPIGTPFGDSLQRSGSYRVLKSQGPGPGHMGGPIAPRYIDQALQEANVYGSVQSVPRMIAQEPMCAYLNMDMQFVRATQSFAETVGIQAIVPRKLQDVVVPMDLEKVIRQQRSLDEERRQKEPNYLPPIYLKVEEERIIQSIGFGPEEMGQVRIDRQETLTFQGPDGPPRSFQVRLGLGKRESTYFVVLILQLQPPQNAYHPAPPQYTREVYPRDQQYSFQPPPQQQYMQHSSPSSYSSASGFDSPMSYRPQGNMASNAPGAANIQGYAQPPRQDYAPPQAQYQPPQAHQQYQQSPQNEMHLGQVQRQRDLQLPPIRDQRGESSVDPARRRDDRSGRVDIGGLIEKPDVGRRGGR